MPTDIQTADLYTPQQLQKFAQDATFAARQMAAAEAKKAEENDKETRKAFMERELDPSVLEHLMTTARRQAERGQREFLALRFSAKLLADGGRRVNNFEPDWPDSLQGFAKRAYNYFQEHLKPAGYGLHVKMLDYPHGHLGDVGLFLSW